MVDVADLERLAGGLARRRAGVVDAPLVDLLLGELAVASRRPASVSVGASESAGCLGVGWCLRVGGSRRVGRCLAAGRRFGAGRCGGIGRVAAGVVFGAGGEDESDRGNDGHQLDAGSSHDESPLRTGEGFSHPSLTCVVSHETHVTRHRSTSRPAFAVHAERFVRTLVADDRRCRCARHGTVAQHLPRRAAGRRRVPHVGCADDLLEAAQGVRRGRADRLADDVRRGRDGRDRHGSRVVVEHLGGAHDAHGSAQPRRGRRCCCRRTGEATCGPSATTG